MLEEENLFWISGEALAKGIGIGSEFNLLLGGRLVSPCDGELSVVAGEAARQGSMEDVDCDGEAMSAAGSVGEGAWSEVCVTVPRERSDVAPGMLVGLGVSAPAIFPFVTPGRKE